MLILCELGDAACRIHQHEQRACEKLVRLGRGLRAAYGAITVIKKRGADSDVATGSSTGFHVGFLIEATRGRVRLLGGNQGDMVKLSNFYLTGYDVRGYRWPQ